MSDSFIIRDLTDEVAELKRDLVASERHLLLARNALANQRAANGDATYDALRVADLSGKLKTARMTARYWEACARRK